MRHDNKKERVAVIKLGGSAVIGPRGVNALEVRQLLQEFQPELANFVHVVFVIGGGNRVREEQARAMDASDEEKDRIGIAILEEHANHLAEIVEGLGYSVAKIPRNAQQLKRLVPKLSAKALVVSGLQPGQSTDTGAVYTAERFRQDRSLETWVVILSNVLTIFTADPNPLRNPDAQNARPIQRANINTLVQEGVLLKGRESWKPGMPVTIDPVAVEMLCSNPPEKLYFTDASNIEDVKRFLRGEATQNGTTLVADNIPTEYYR